jgi:hypothetical protein
MTTEVDDLVSKVQKQLEEHKAWLAAEIGKISPWVRLIGEQTELVNLSQEIKLRVTKVSNGVVTAIYDYPDKLYMFLRSEDAPRHLRDSLDGHHVVNPNQPTFTAKRVHDE